MDAGGGRQQVVAGLMRFSPWLRSYQQLTAAEWGRGIFQPLVHTHAQHWLDLVGEEQKKEEETEKRRKKEEDEEETGKRRKMEGTHVEMAGRGFDYNILYMCEVIKE